MSAHAVFVFVYNCRKQLLKKTKRKLSEISHQLKKTKSMIYYKCIKYT
ncbi:hypothetical protein D920_00753 [Enterococcus faecalis 13-SD-W-01]|nr:hypothetical protein D920_00753 [Enterococcus faecalis 13-SD-W-01]